MLATRPTLSVLIVALLLFFLAVVIRVPFAQAESVVWTDTVLGRLQVIPTGAGYPSRYTSAISIDDPTVNITYRARAVNADTSEVIACGGTVLKGTNIRFEFEPHVYSDIYWFTTGASWDSPYGEWREQAAPSSIQCVGKDYVGSGVTRQGSVRHNIYVSLVGNEPPKFVSGIDEFMCGSPGTDGSVSCVASQRGSFTPQFNFEPTFGKFYGRVNFWGRCWGSNLPMGSLAAGSSDNSNLDSYTLQVPKQQISCPITVINTTGEPPTASTVSAVSSCSYNVGTDTYTQIFSLATTDPDNDDVRFGIDWSGDNFIDQFTTYVPSGATTQVVKNWATPGEKTFRVLAQDQKQLTSPWTTLTTLCTQSDYDSNYDSEATTIITTIGDGDGSDGGTLAKADIKAIPSLVQPDQTTQIHWTSNNVESCGVTGDNGDGPWEGTLSSAGGETSSPISDVTTYTLTCTTFDDDTITDTATVRHVPVWEEF